MNKWKEIEKKLRNLPKKFTIILFILWLISMGIAIYVGMKPLYVEEKVQTNRITQKTSFDYQTQKLPNEIIGFDGLIFPKTQNSIDVSIDTMISSEAPIEVEGSYFITLKLIAEGLWESNIPLTQKQSFRITGEKNQIMENKVTIDLQKIYNDTEWIANEIVGVRPSKYTLKVQSIIEGIASYKDKKVNLDTASDITFEVSHSQVTLTGEKEFVKQIPIEESKMTEQTINLLGLTMSISTARYILTMIVLCMSILCILVILSKKKLSKERMTETEFIEKKYKNRFVPIEKQLDDTNKVCIPLQSFQSLVRIADEKDQGILQYYNAESDKVDYYVIDGTDLYTYTLQNTFKNEEMHMNMM